MSSAFKKCEACGEVHAGPYPKQISQTRMCYDTKYGLEPLVEGKQVFGGKEMGSVEVRDENSFSAIEPTRYVDGRIIKD